MQRPVNAEVARYIQCAAGAGRNLIFDKPAQSRVIIEKKRDRNQQKGCDGSQRQTGARHFSSLRLRARDQARGRIASGFYFAFSCISSPPRSMSLPAPSMVLHPATNAMAKIMAAIFCSISISLEPAMGINVLLQ